VCVVIFIEISRSESGLNQISKIRIAILIEDLTYCSIIANTEEKL